MNEILMCGTDPVGQLYKDTKAEATSIAPIEVSPAESSHSVGTHIMVDGVRYKVTSAISVGDTLTIGTNISAEDIEDNLDATHIPYDSNTSVKEKIDENAILTTIEQITTNSSGDAILSLSSSQYALLSALKLRNTLDSSFCYTNGYGYSANGDYVVRVFDGSNQAYTNKTIDLRLYYCKMPS